MLDRNSVLLFWIMVLISVGVVSVSIFGLSMLAQVHPRAEGVNEQFGLKLTMTLEKTVYTLGEPINITLTITNISNQTISYAYAALGWRFDFRVYNDTNNRIYQWSADRAFAWALDSIALNPRESLTVGQLAGTANHVPTGYYIWDETWNVMSVSPPYPNSTQVDPGTYYIVGQTGPIVLVNGKDIGGVIETTPIQIILVKQ
jgi:hypothetical protein